MKILLALVVIAATIFAFNMPRKSGLPKPLKSLSVPLSVLPFKATATADPKEEARRQSMLQRASQDWGRDPFSIEGGRLKAVKGEPGKAPLNLKLTGIVWDQGKTHAVINDYVVKVGDEIGGARVVAIQKDSVLLIKDGVQHTLRLGE
ncbi:MAG: hypothetical protein HY998_00090 [candidate division NC10 bacterium]|nr:hypothetical protein [candidate division NC10 bacterium]